MNKQLLATAVVFGLSYAASAAAVGTAKWVGGTSGTFSTLSNWEFTDTSGEAMPFAAADFANKSLNFDFSGLTASATLTNDVSAIKAMCALSAPAGVTLTLVGTTGSNIFLKNEPTVVSIPAGATLVWGLRHKIDWSADKMFTISGGGTFVMDTAVDFAFYSTAASTPLVLDGSTFIYRRMGGTDNKLNMIGLRMVGDGAQLKLEDSMRLGHISSMNATAGAQLVDVPSGKTLTLSAGSAKGVGDYNGQITGSGTIRLMSGTKQILRNSPSFTGTVRFVIGDLDLADDATLNSSVKFVSELSGRLRLTNDQSLASMSTIKLSLNGTARNTYGMLGGIDVSAGKTLTAAGTGSAQTDTFYSRVTGDGSFVKDGASYTLNLKGQSRYAGTTEVKAGTLALSSELSAEHELVTPGAVVHMSFEDPNQFNANSVKDGPVIPQLSTAQLRQVDGIVGKGLYFGYDPATFKSYGGFVGTTDKTPRAGEDFTISVWLKPDQIIGKMVDYIGVLQHGDWEPKSIRWMAFNKALTYAGLRTHSFSAAGEKDSWAKFATSLTETTALTNDWHHYAFTCKDLKVTAYLDGVKVGEDTSQIQAPTNLTDKLWIGHTYVGSMDELIYARGAWTEAQVKAEYARCTQPALKGIHDPAEDLPAPVAHWAFEDPTDLGKDSSGNGYDLEPMGKAGMVYLQKDRPGAFGNYALLVNSGQSSGSADTSYGALKIKGNVFPEKIPTGRKSFSVSIRYQMPYESGYSIVYWGGATAETNNYFRIKNGSMPHTPRADFTHLSREAGKYHDATAASSVEMGNEVSEASWQHVVFTYDAEKHYCYVYVDGVYDKNNWVGVQLPGGGNAYPDILAEAFYVGYCPDGNYKYAGFALDDLRIYDRVLTETEVKVLAQSLETGKVGPTLPEGTPVSVAAGATLSVSGAGHVFGGLTGTGSVALDGSASVAVSKSSAFTGTLSGLGTLLATDGATVDLTGAKGLPSSLDAENGTFALPAGCSSATMYFGSGGRMEAEAFAGNVVLKDGIEIATDAAKAGLPIAATAGAVTIPATGTVKVSGVSTMSETVFPLARGGSFVLPQTFDGWSLEAASTNPMIKRVSFEVRDGVFQMRVRYHGLMLLLR